MACEIVVVVIGLTIVVFTVIREALGVVLAAWIDVLIGLSEVFTVPVRRRACLAAV